MDREGHVVGKPEELAEAELVIALCDRFHVLPSALLAEDVSLLRMLEILMLGRPNGE